MALVAGGYLWLRGGLPQTEGSVAVAGLEREVELLRDDDGNALVLDRASGKPVPAETPGIRPDLKGAFRRAGISTE